jgi:hypothetical protein
MAVDRKEEHGRFSSSEDASQHSEMANLFEEQDFADRTGRRY